MPVQSKRLGERGRQKVVLFDICPSTGPVLLINYPANQSAYQLAVTGFRWIRNECAPASSVTLPDKLTQVNLVAHLN